MFNTFFLSCLFLLKLAVIVVGALYLNERIHSEPDKTSYVNKLNDFYARFDCHDFSSEISNAKSKCQSVLSE